MEFRSSVVRSLWSCANVSLRCWAACGSESVRRAVGSSSGQHSVREVLSARQGTSVTRGSVGGVPAGLPAEQARPWWNTGSSGSESSEAELPPLLLLQALRPLARLPCRLLLSSGAPMHLPPNPLVLGQLAGTPTTEPARNTTRPGDEDGVAHRSERLLLWVREASGPNGEAAKSCKRLASDLDLSTRARQGRSCTGVRRRSLGEMRCESSPAGPGGCTSPNSCREAGDKVP